MRIYAYFSPVIKILLWIMFALSVFCVFLGILGAANVPNAFNISRADGVVLISSMPLIAAFIVSVATVHYTLDDTHLRLKIAFWDILGGRIAVENILNIVYADGKMYISYLWTGYDPVIAQISVAPKNFDKLKDSLMAKNKRIVFYDDNKSNTDDDEA